MTKGSSDIVKYLPRLFKFGWKYKTSTKIYSIFTALWVLFWFLNWILGIAALFSGIIALERFIVITSLYLLYSLVIVAPLYLYRNKKKEEYRKLWHMINNNIEVLKKSNVDYSQINEILRQAALAADWDEYEIAFERLNTAKELSQRFLYDPPKRGEERGVMTYLEELREEQRAQKEMIEASFSRLHEEHERFFYRFDDLRSDTATVKSQEDPVDEKIDRMKNILSNYETQLKKSEGDKIARAEEKLSSEIPYWEKLEKDSRMFFITAEILYEFLLERREESTDFSPAALEYCKVLELELNSKLFVLFKNKMRSEFKNEEGLRDFLGQDLDFKETRMFAQYILDQRRITLGDINRFISYLTGRRTIAKSPLLQRFKAYIEEGASNPNYFSEKEKLPEALRVVTKRYRNGAAHTEAMQKETLEECRSHIRTGTGDLLEALG